MRLPRTVKLTGAAPGGQRVAGAGAGRQVSPDNVLQGANGHHSSHDSLSAMDQESPTSRGHAVDVVDLMNSSWWGPSRLHFGTGTTNSSQQSTPRFRSGPRLKEEGRQHGRRSSQQQARQLQRQASSRSNSSAGSAKQQQQQTGAVATAGLGQGRDEPFKQALPMPTPTVAVRSQQTQRRPEWEAVQDLPGIGTWAGRYRLFGRRRSLDRDGKESGWEGPLPPSPPQAPSQQADELREQQQQAQQQAQQHASEQQLSPPPVTPERQARYEGRGSPSTCNSEDAREAAWRWRFSRKWEAEQHKYYTEGLEPSASYASNDELEALEYTQACGVGTHMQFLNSASRGARSNSVGGSALLRSVSGMSVTQLEANASLHSMGGLSEEVSPGNSTHGGGAGGALRHGNNGSVHGAGSGLAFRTSGSGANSRNPLPDATAGVLRVASRARDLLQKQEAIVEAAAAMWEAGPMASSAWAGRDLVPVQIDQWGRFHYVVVRVSDGPGHHQKFLVRGRNGLGQAEAVEAVQRQIAAARRAQALPPVLVEVVGRGIMEWREDTGRHLLITSACSSDPAFPVHGSSSPTKGPAMLDLGGLTASLVRQALPCHFQITNTSDTARASSASMSALGGNRI